MTTTVMKAIKLKHAILSALSKIVKYLLRLSKLIFNKMLVPINVKPMNTVVAILTAKNAGKLVLTKLAIRGFNSTALED